MLLDDILLTKREEVTALKTRWAGQDPERLMKSVQPPRDFLQNFTAGKIALIAEIKKASPSAGLIHPDFDPAAIAKIYEQNGAAAISVLTDKKFFQGELFDLIAVKEAVNLPVLRKDFIVDELQVYEARSAGADAILLIVRILTPEKLQNLLGLTKKLGMRALVEAHNEGEVEMALKSSAEIIGVNNRDLDTLKTDINNTVRLLKQFPELRSKIIVSESGLGSRADVELLKEVGVNGVLIGESLLKSRDIAAKIKELLG